MEYQTTRYKHCGQEFTLKRLWQVFRRSLFRNRQGKQNPAQTDDFGTDISAEELEIFQGDTPSEGKKIKCKQCGRDFTRKRAGHIFCESRCRKRHWREQHHRKIYNLGTELSPEERQMFLGDTPFDEVEF